MPDLFQDLVNFLGPNEGLGILIVDSDEFLNGLDELRHSLEHTAPDSFPCNLAKPTLHQVQPGRTGRGKMQMKPAMLFQPLLDTIVIVGSIIIQDQMQIKSRWGLAID